jgi:hypothetical protein
MEPEWRASLGRFYLTLDSFLETLKQVTSRHECGEITYVEILKNKFEIIEANFLK